MIDGFAVRQRQHVEIVDLRAVWRMHRLAGGVFEDDAANVVQPMGSH